MESDSWSTRFSTSRRNQSSLQSRSDLYMGFEEIDVDDDIRAEFPCPFCGEDFDLVGLCCHIDDEHPAEAKNGVCPICAVRVGLDLVGHITVQHGSFFKLHRRRRLRKSTVGSHATLSLLRKELKDSHLQSLFRTSNAVSSNAAPDPLLSSFIYNFPVADEPKNVHSQSLDEKSIAKSSPNEKKLDSHDQALSDKDQKERAQRSKFVQGLVMSTILDDYNF